MKIVINIKIKNNKKQLLKKKNKKIKKIRRNFLTFKYK